MVYGIIILIITGGMSFAIISHYGAKYKYFDAGLMKKVYFMHVFLTIVYYLYALFNNSDSHFYYEKILIDFRGPTWMDFYGTSTTFIEWLGYPFVRFLGFSYEAIMILYSFFGFLGFIYFYLFFKENVKFKHKLFGFDLLTLILLLPNLHFWSASLGKGSVIFLGIGLFFFGLKRPTERWVEILISSLLIYHIRPHIMFVILASALIGFTFSNKGISTATRVAMIMVGLVSFAFIYQDVLSMVGIEEGEEISQGLDLTHRATELTKATSGVDITNYSLPFQLFTFLFRPLFVDAPGMLGLIVSFENVFYLIVAIRIFTPKGIRFLIQGNFLVKTAFFSFLTVSIALAQIAGNLGIAIRQKSQVMPLFLFVILVYMDQGKMKEYLQRKRRKQQMKKLADQLETTA